RSPREAACVLDSRVHTMGWDGQTHGAWQHELESADAVINLAGEPIADKRWTKARRQILRESRVGPTRLLVEALGRLPGRPRTFINTSGVGYYGPRDATAVSEQTSSGSGFLAELSTAGERQAMQAEDCGIRVIRLRIGIVLGKDGGALPRMILPFRFLAGGPILPGDQWISWIHRQDLIGIIQWTLGNPQISGPVNGVAPGSVTMNEFSRTIGHVLGRPSWLPIPELVLRLALGDLATILTTGQRVEPAVALQGGYVFRYPTLEPALHEIMATTSKPCPRDLSKKQKYTDG
ncbi:MAG TPA: TIGR01777 family oxidoreductase, partial [Nitrospiraceae bacterium]|nr:TIGR01777 family oxidoreductase [Nitrospiraceae bacterium]